MLIQYRMQLALYQQQQKRDGGYFGYALKGKGIPLNQSMLMRFKEIAHPPRIVEMSGRCTLGLHVKARAKVAHCYTEDENAAFAAEAEAEQRIIEARRPQAEEPPATPPLPAPVDFIGPRPTIINVMHKGKQIEIAVRSWWTEEVFPVEVRDENVFHASITDEPVFRVTVTDQLAEKKIDDD